MFKFILTLLLIGWSTGAWADFKVATGTITTPTSTGNAAVTGVGFTPKVIILYSTVVSSLSQGIISGMGVCQSSSARWTMGLSQLQGGTASNNLGRQFKSDKCLNVIQDSVTTYLESDLVTMDADGFTLNWTTVQGTGKPVYYIALGGTSLNAKVGTFDTGTGTGAQAITGVGFLPTTVLVGNTISGTTEGLTTANVWSIGFGQSSSNRFMSNFFSNLNSATFEERAKQKTDLIVSRMTNGGSITEEGDLTSLDSDGFTLNFSVNSVAKRHGYLALNGVNAVSGVFNQAAATGNASVSGLAFQPKAVLFLSRGLVTSSTVDIDPGVSIGAAVSSSSRNVISFSGKENLSTIIAGTDGSASKCIQLISAVSGAVPTLKAEADFVSMDATGFTINWTTADATAREVGYWALGEVSASSTGSVINSSIWRDTVFKP